MIDELWRILWTVILAAAFLPGCDSPHDDPPEAPRVDPAQVEAALDAAERYMAMGNMVEAEAIAIRLSRLDPEHFAPDDLLGRICVGRALAFNANGREAEADQAFSEAHDHYMEAVRKAPGIPGLQQSAGEIAQLAGRLDAAMEHFKAAAELSPEEPAPPLYIAQLLIAGGSPEEARPWVQKVLAIVPGQPHALATRAVLEMDLGNVPEAFEAIDSARSALPVDVGIRVIEARLYRQHDDPERALELLLSLPRQLQADEGVAGELAVNWGSIGRHDRSAETWAFCFASMPDVHRSGRVALKVAEAWIEDRQFEKAAVWIEQAELLGVPGEQVELVRVLAREAEESQD
jgi:tetratricopeptide (TPR) repeat protein